jgi:hypothetical protein
VGAAIWYIACLVKPQTDGCGFKTPTLPFLNSGIDATAPAGACQDWPEIRDLIRMEMNLKTS